VGTAVMVDKETREMRPVPEFLNIPGLVKDMQKITDAARGKWMSNLMMGLALLKHYNPYKSPSQFTLYELFKKFDKSFGLTGKDYGKVSGDRSQDDIEKRRSDRWNFLFIAGMWFQTSVAPRCALFPTERKRVRFPSVLTIRASDGETSSRTCTRTRRWQSGMRKTVVTRSLLVVKKSN
jgi:hypothetical protein